MSSETGIYDKVLPISAEIGALHFIRAAVPQLLRDIDPYTIADALRRAAAHGYIEIVELLFNSADLNYYDHRMSAPTGTLALLAAVTNNRLNIMTYLLSHGIDVNASDDSDQTALILAVESEIEDARHIEERTGYIIQPSAQITELLLTYGAHVNVMDKYGRTPLSIARHTHPVAEKMLREAGAR